MNEKDKAAENLEVIRSLMERATVYRAISGPTALFAGVVATLGGWWFDFSRSSQFVGSWLGVLFLVLCFNTYLVVRKSVREGSRIFSPGLKMALISILPALVVAGVITAYSEVRLEVRGLVWTWMTLYGLALMSTRSFSPRSLWWLGLAFLLTGLVCLHYLDSTHYRESKLYGIPTSGHYLMIYTFGFYHLCYGFWVMIVEKENA